MLHDEFDHLVRTQRLDGVARNLIPARFANGFEVKARGPKISERALLPCRVRLKDAIECCELLAPDPV
jgi:hypothetical protein